MTIYHCNMPGFCGYGIDAYAATQAEAEQLARQLFLKMRADWNVPDRDHFKTFAAAMAFFGGTITAIPLPCVAHERQAGKCVKEY